MMMILMMLVMATVLMMQDGDDSYGNDDVGEKNEEYFSDIRTSLLCMQLLSTTPLGRIPFTAPSGTIKT